MLGNVEKCWKIMKYWLLKPGKCGKVNLLETTGAAGDIFMGYVD